MSRKLKMVKLQSANNMLNELCSILKSLQTGFLVCLRPQPKCRVCILRKENKGVEYVLLIHTHTKNKTKNLDDSVRAST